MKTIKLSQYGIVISPDKVNAIHEEMRAGVGEPIILDFKDVKGIDSAAAHELIKSMRGHKGALVQMKNASPMVKSVMMYSSGTTGSVKAGVSASAGRGRKPRFSFFRIFAMITLLLTLACGNVWGETGTVTWTGKGSTVSAASSGTMSSYLTGATSFTATGVNGSSNSKDKYFGSWQNASAAANTSTYTSQVYITFAVTSGYTFEPTAITFSAYPNNSGSGMRGFITDGTTTVYSAANTGSGSAQSLSFDLSGTTKMSGTIKVGLDFCNTTAGKNFWISGNTLSITGTVESAAPSCAVDHVDVTGSWHIWNEGSMALTATAYDDEDNVISSDITYQWYKGGTEEGNKIVGATSATYSKDNCNFDDAGYYYCKVSAGGGCDATSGGYAVKMLRVYVKNSKNGSDYGFIDLTDIGSYESQGVIRLATGGKTYGFGISDGCGDWYGNDGTMISSNCTNWPMDKNADCGLTSTSVGSYTFTVKFGNLYDSGKYGDKFKVSVNYPSNNQAASKVIYFDNSDLNWSNIYYRIGNSGHNQNTSLTAVPGTAHLYKVTTSKYDGLEAWHIANNTGWSGSNSIYKTKTNDKYAITAATEFDGAAVTDAAITILPQSGHYKGGADENNNCDFYYYNLKKFLVTHTATINATTNGSIRLNWKDINNDAQSATSTTAGLAHTCNLQVTAVPATGYETATLTVNGSNHTSGNVHVLNANATIAATFRLVNYNVTYSAPSNGSYTIKVADGSASSASNTATYGQTITLAASPSSHYHFTGWTITNTDNSTDITNSVSLSDQTENATFIMPAANISITATFAIDTYTVTFVSNNDSYGTVSSSSISSIPHGSTVSINGSTNALTLNGSTITVSPTTSTAAYTYAFSSWSVDNGDEITGTTTITATFTRTAKTYDVDVTLTDSKATMKSGTTGSNAATFGTNHTLEFEAVSGYELPDDVTVTIGGSPATEGTEYTWNSSTGTVVIGGSYILGNISITVTAEEEGGGDCTPINASITFDNNKSAKYNTSWEDGDVVTSGGASWAKNSIGSDTGHPMTKPAMKLDDTGDYLKITLPSGVATGTITVLACTYSGKTGTLIINDENNSDTPLASAEVGLVESTQTYKINTPDGESWTAPTLKTLSYDVTSGGDYYIKQSAGNSIYIYAFSATGTKECACSTPSAPTSPTNGATTSNSQAVSWTDTSNSAWEVYVSTGSSTPAADQTPTAEPTSASYTFTSLTASTTYYWWVRSVCDDTHKSSWVAGTSFETSAAGEDPIPALISYYLQTPGKKTTPASLSTDSIVTTPARLKGDTLKNFVPVTLGSSLGITKAGKGDGGTWSAGIGNTPADSATAVTDAYAAKLAFDVHDDYELNISSITLKVLSVTNGSQIYRVKVSDGEHTVYGRVAPGKDTESSVVFGSFSGIKFSGTVTLTLWVWSTAAAEYRLKSPIQIDGTLTRKASACTMPTQTFSAGAYTLGGAALNLSSLFSSNSSGAVTYSVVNAGGTSAAIVGSSFTASNTGTATIRATQAADTEGGRNYCAKSIETTITVSGTCTPQSLSKVVVTGGSAGTVTGYNDGQYAGDAVVNLYSKSPQSASLPEVGTVDGYKMGDDGTSIVFATLKGTSFQVDDKVKIGITKKSDNRTVDASTDILTIYYGTSKTDVAVLHTITDVTGAGFYEYTLTSADVTAIGSKKGIGLFRESSNGENPFVYSVEIIGCRDWAVCTAPNAVAASGATHNSALLTVTDAAATGDYEFYYSESSTEPTASTAATATGSSLTKTITGLSASTTYYYWVRSNCGDVTKSAWVAGTPASFTTAAAAATHNVTYNGNGSTDGSVPTDDTDYEEGDVVTVLGNTGSLVKTGQTFLGWSTNATASSGTFYPAGYKFYMPNEAVTLYAVWGSTAEEKYYYGSITITAGALTPGSTGTKGFFTNNGGEIATSSAISLSSTPSETGYYYESSTLTHTALNKSSNWNTSSTAKRTIRAFKFKSGDSYTLALGSKVATSIMFYGKCGSASKTMSVGGQEYESPSTKEQFFSHEFTKVGNFTSNVTITQDGDFYGILVVTISTGAASGFTVSFNIKDHGSAIADIENVPSGSKIGAPVPAPTAADYEFGGWYKDDELSDDWDFANDQVTVNTTLYAKWSNCAPTITTDPVSANYNQNGVASALTVAANDNGGGTLHYQWWVKENNLPEEDGSVIPGETGNSFTPSTELLGTSYYYCVVSNDCGNVKTNTAEVTIRDTKPDPTAVWDVEEPTHGGKGFTFSVIAKNDDGTDLWDGTLTEEMLSVSSEAVLGTVTVNNETKTISGTYGVKASATSPVTFYLLLPATETFAAKRLDYDRTFTACVGGDGSTYRVPVRKDSEKDASNNYRWVTAGAGEISYTYGSTISSGKATSSYNSFDSIVSSDKQNLYVRTYNANIKKVTLYVLTGGKDITVESIYKQTSYKGADDKDKLSTAAYSVTYDDGSDENTGAKGNHYIVITLEDPLEANDILMFKFSKSNVKAYGAVFTQTADGGTETPTLGWSPSIDGNVEKNENAADFTYTATRSNDEAVASLGIISYSSSNTTVATVNATTGQVTIADNIDFGSADHIDVTITATLSASGCYKKATTTYTLRVKKYVCSEAVGTVDIQTDNACSGKVLAVSGYEAGATIQWYKNGAAIPGEIGTTYTATTAGAYYVVTHKDCDAVSNEITINFGAATATKIVDEWYVKNDRRTPDIALVQTTNATGFTVTSSGDPVTSIGGCTFELKEDGIIYLHGTTSTGAAPSGMTPGNMTITITATACSNAAPLDIVLHIQPETAKPTVAFVVDGTLRKDGGTATSVLEAKTSERPIWKYLANTFALTGCNAYWSVDSKELRQYYSQFDAILITDDPSTDTKGTGGVSYVKAFGTMVDVRPVLTMEAYVGKFKDGGWHVYDATPTSPNPRQVEMKLECKNHDIFKGLNPATSDNVRTTTDEYGNEYWHVIMVDTTQSPYHNTKDSYEALPALQGFDRTKFSNMLGVGTIFEEKLQGGVERQEEPAARMMILGIQNNAMGALTNEGKLIVKNALEYLLKTNMEDVNDCANYFTNADGDGLWSNGANWTRGEVPDFETRARILTPVTIGNGTTAIAARVDIAASGESKHVDGECTGKVTINPTGALIVGGKIRRADAPHFGIDNLMPTENSDLIVRASSDGPHYQGALIHDNTDGLTHAEVEMWNPSHWEVEGGKKKKYWSYVAVPIQEADIPNFFWHGFTYLYDETSGWEKKFDGSSLYPFQGIGASLQTGNIEWFYGPLATTENQDITLTYTADKGQGMNLIGNSWTAPIQIANFEEDDFGDATPEVWVFNTGNTNDGHTTMADGDAGTTTAGQWQTIPIGVAGLPGYTGLKVIPAMQAFEVNTTSETTLHLDYDRLVRAGRENLNEPMRAPRRSAAKEIEATMRVRVSGELTHTDVYLLKDARFSDGFDNGWDGHYLSGDDRSAQLYAISEEEGKLAFLAQPEIEGTVLGFAPSKDGNEYTFSFSYDGDEEYYLNDLKLTSSTLISNESSYLFTYEAGDTNRFYISRQPLGGPAITTGVDEVREEAKPRKFIYNDKMYILFNGRVFDATGKAVK